MAFGRCNAPATFERLMDTLLGDLRCLIYLDDIIFHAMTFDLELRRLRPVFFRLWTANLKLSPKKCELFRRKVKFLGPVVCEDGVTTDPDKVKAVQNWPVPHNAKAVVRFVGLCNYYRRCVCSFSDVARPLHQLCEKGQPFEGTSEPLQFTSGIPRKTSSYLHNEQCPLWLHVPIFTLTTLRQSYVPDTKIPHIRIIHDRQAHAPIASCYISCLELAL